MYSNQGNNYFLITFKEEEMLKQLRALSEDDRKRNEMYQANLKREKAQASFADYAEYLKSLDMKATI